MIICIDEWGYFSINGNYIGKLENFQLLLDYIDENREKAIQIEELLITGKGKNDIEKSL